MSLRQRGRKLTLKYTRDSPNRVEGLQSFFGERRNRTFLLIGQEMRHELRPAQFVSEDELLVTEWTCAFRMWPLEPCLELFLLLLLRGKVIVNDETLVRAYDFR